MEDLPPTDPQPESPASLLGRSFVAPLLAATAVTVGSMVALLVLTGSPPPAAPSGGQGAAAPRPSRPPQALFAEFCAQCHGPNGDGDGVTELARPARSFADGGYGYGNTPQIVMRTLEFGIPGSAMPAFGDILTEGERASLANYVLSLGPDRRRVSRDELRVEPGHDGRAVVVQGAAVHPETGEVLPHALFACLPAGVTVMFPGRSAAAGAVWRGGVERRDWRGQGGAPVRPTGELVWRAEGEAAAGAPRRGYRIDGAAVELAGEAGPVRVEVRGDTLEVGDLRVPLR